MAPLDTGRFIITNSKFKNAVFLGDANSCSDIHGEVEDGRPGEKWNVVLLSNGNYTMKNYGHSSYATCQFIARADAGNSIVGGGEQYQWKIIEVGSNSYVICPTKNGQVYWHLTDEEIGTPITLQPYTQSGKIQWEFTRIDDGDALGGGPTGRVLANLKNDTPSTPVQRAPTLPASPSVSEIVERTIKSGKLYTLRIIENNRYLGVPFLKSWVDTYKFPKMADSWLFTKCGDNWQIQVRRSREFLSIPSDGEGRVSDVPNLLSLIPIGGPNEFRIIQVDNGRSWDGLVIEYDDD